MLRSCKKDFSLMRTPAKNSRRVKNTSRRTPKKRTKSRRRLPGGKRSITERAALGLGYGAMASAAAALPLSYVTAKSIRKDPRFKNIAPLTEQQKQDPQLVAVHNRNKVDIAEDARIKQNALLRWAPAVAGLAGVVYGASRTD
jgi:hypothetical protein